MKNQSSRVGALRGRQGLPAAERKEGRKEGRNELRKEGKEGGKKGRREKRKEMKNEWKEKICSIGVRCDQFGANRCHLFTSLKHNQIIDLKK